MSTRFNRAVVIGSSGGIGRALAAALSNQGAQVHALSRLGLALDHQTRAGPIDVTNEASIACAAASIGADGPIDIVIVATGLLHSATVFPEKSYRQLSPGSLDRYFAVNAIGPALIAKHFLPLLHPDQRSVFAVLSARVSSISDNRLGGWYGYRASKAALNMIVKTLAIELARTRPSAVCVALHPGTVDTELSKPFQRGVAADQLFTATTAAGHLLDIVAALEPNDSGHCFAWSGSKIEP